MSNWEPEEVSDADMEGIAGGAGGQKPTNKPEKKPGVGIDGGDGKPDPTRDSKPGTGPFKKK